MNDNIYQPPEASVESEPSSETNLVEGTWQKLNKIWFFTTVFAFIVLGVLSSIPFKGIISTTAIDLLTSTAFIISGIWWVVLDQFERDSDTPTLLIAGIVLIPILAFPIYCYWSRGLLNGSLQLLKLFIYAAICVGLQIGMTVTLDQVVA